ncbi:long-chain fatty acid--CoA ligase [Bacillus sp. MRMR6]|uniref:acyl-CoA synthetase n=1 Tax=Bacillus sp. MRMR6 TaxID=1928617 RepID=UPI000952E8EE|nr:long-chain fatty acid--CoA ligase [Bacillus sp. MRMR6]OLS40726.1 hypothetical protein BTR25_07465 [Bacillus sp. MRMR6]
MKVGTLIRRAAQRYRHLPALIMEDRTFSFLELDERSNRLANALLGIGLKPGDRVAVLFSNQPESVEVYFALAKAGLIRTPLNYRETTEDHVYKINDSGSIALLFGKGFSDEVFSIQEALSEMKVIIGPERVGPFVRDYESILAQASSTAPPEPTSSFYRLGYTGGTTGRPKGVMLSHENEFSQINSFLMELLPVKQGDIMLHSAPIAHGSGAFVLPHFLRGATNLILPKFDPERFSHMVEKERVTTTFLVPTMIGSLLESQLEKYDLSSLKSVVYSAAPMPVERLKEAITRMGPIFAQTYGQTEAPIAITRLLKEEHSMAYEGRLSSAGREYLYMQVSIVDENGNHLPPGEIGEVIARGPQVMLGYWQRPEETAKTIRNGWLHTGDMGYLDNEGYLFLVDRMKDLIISGGYNIYPREVEEVLYQHPAILEAAVIGVPHEKWGESVKAVVVTRPSHSLSEKEIIHYCKQKIAHFKCPKSVDFISTLPKSAVGKILRREIRSPYWQEKENKLV